MKESADLLRLYLREFNREYLRRREDRWEFWRTLATGAATAFLLLVVALILWGWS
jgi:hypothetical protein